MSDEGIPTLDFDGLRAMLWPKMETLFRADSKEFNANERFLLVNAAVEDSAARIILAVQTLREQAGNQQSPQLQYADAVLGLLNSQWPHTWAEPCERERIAGRFKNTDVCVTHGQNMPCPIPAVAALVSGKLPGDGQ